jgi:hypothetical protein
MDGRMRAVQTNEQQMEQTEPRVDAGHPPKKPPGRAILYRGASSGKLSARAVRMQRHDEPIRCPMPGGRDLRPALFGLGFDILLLAVHCNNLITTK